jgi:hypothetical protein
VISTGFPGASSLIGKRVVVDLSAGLVKMTVDSETQQATFTPGTITSTSAIGIFAALKNGAYQSWSPMDGMILHSFEIYESGTLVHRFIPAIDGNDVACVYDEVTQEYKYHSGGGTLEFVESGVIAATYLKVSGSWLPLIGQNIDDVNLGGE